MKRKMKTIDFLQLKQRIALLPMKDRKALADYLEDLRRQDSERKKNPARKTPAKADWKTLRIGDRIRFVGLPSEFSKPGYHVAPETIRIYRMLVNGKPVRVDDIDEYGAPWISTKTRECDGVHEHSLRIDHDGWVRVRSRKTGASSAK